MRKIIIVLLSIFIFNCSPIVTVNNETLNPPSWIIGTWKTNIDPSIDVSYTINKNNFIYSYSNVSINYLTLYEVITDYYDEDSYTVVFNEYKYIFTLMDYNIAELFIKPFDGIIIGPFILEKQ